MKYRAMLDGECSGVEPIEDGDFWCQACGCKGHRTERAAHRCLARWFSRQAATFRALARQEREEAKRC